MDIVSIVKQLVDDKIFQAAPTFCKQLSGGTVSELYLLNVEDKKYVIKKNHPQITKFEAKFLDHYRETNIVPKLFFIEKSFKYIIYSYMDGSTHYDGKNKKEVLQTLVHNLLNHYKPCNGNEGWGWADNPSESWDDFIIEEIKAAYGFLQNRLDDSHFELVQNLAENNNTSRQPYLLHGDCGIHNFLFKDEQLCAVIDPSPVIGEPMYDLIYAFCSSPDDLTKETFDSAANLLILRKEETPAVFYNDVLIGLYLRLATCIKHHPKDWETYFQAWSYWVEIAKSGK